MRPVACLWPGVEEGAAPGLFGEIEPVLFELLTEG